MRSVRCGQPVSQLSNDEPAPNLLYRHRPVAQFGRGVMADVSSKLLGQFVECLHYKVLTGEGPEAGAAPQAAAAAAPSTPPAAETPAPEIRSAPTEMPAAPSTPAASPGVRKIDAPEAQAVDLGRVAGGAVAKRVVPVVVVAAVVIGVVIWLLVR